MHYLEYKHEDTRETLRYQITAFVYKQAEKNTVCVIIVLFILTVQYTTYMDLIVIRTYRTISELRLGYYYILPLTYLLRNAFLSISDISRIRELGYDNVALS